MSKGGEGSIGPGPSKGAGPSRSAPGDRQRKTSRGGERRRSAARPSERRRRADPARLAAYTLLRSVAEGAYANLEMPRILQRMSLRDRDAAFATELAFGTIRWQGLYDRFIAIAADREVSRIDDNVVDTLRLGAHQLFGMRVPVHAAADESVALARQVNGAGAAGLVNAVMRRLSERDRAEWVTAATPPDLDSTEALAIAQSHPLWVTKALRQALLGHGAADPQTIDEQLAALLRTNNEPAKVTLTARPGLCTRADLVAQGARLSDVSPIGAVLESGNPGQFPQVRDGRAAVQDEGSQLVALAVAEAEVVDVDQPDQPLAWLDLCAGPGGKAGILAGLAVDAGADLVCVEISEHRAQLVDSTLHEAKQRANERGLDVTVRVADGREVGLQEPGRYARVLLDAPCTGLGALRRRPEARWRRQPADLATLGPLQRELLDSAVAALAPGGIVGYSTCSPHLAETTLVVSDVLRTRDDIEILDAAAAVNRVSERALVPPGEGPFAQLWPHRDGTDGMFLALLRKRRAHD